MKKMTKLLYSALSAVVLLLALPLSVLAIADPDTAPSVNAVYVYENCLEEGDTGVLIDYYLDYSPLPTVANATDTATNAYMAAFVDTDNTTQLKTAAPYTFTDSGYGRGLIWIYFSAAETTAYSIDSTDIALYGVWLMGNPTVGSGWTGDPPKTSATIDQWVTVSNPSTVIAARVLYYADQLEVIWSLDMITELYGGGSALTSTGESYFVNVILSLRSIAPGAFSSVETDPDYHPISYSTTFGATATNGTANITGSPVTLTPKILIANYSFETSNPPIAWTLVGADATFVRSAVQSEDGTYSGLLTRLGTNCYINQTIDVTDYAGDTLTLGMWTYATVADRARIALIDNVGAIGYSANHSGVPGWEWLTVAYAIDATATQLDLRGYVDTGDTSVYFDNAALVEAINIIDTGATTGTVIIDLAGWTFGSVMDGTGTVTGSPVDIAPGVNTLTVTGAGTFTVVVAEVTTVTIMEDTVAGTGFDLTALAKVFGMSRWFFSGVVWMLITLLVCAAVYRTESRGGVFGEASDGGGKAVMSVFSLMVIGGALLGMLSPLVAALLFIASGAFIGYILFFRSDALHKGFMFMFWMFIIVSLAGNYAAGSNALVATPLTVAVSANATTAIYVASTDGFASSGVIVIGDEQIGYPSKNATAFTPTLFNPIVRGMSDTEAATHAVGASVRTREAGILNSAIDYKIARISDSAGVMGFITFPAKLLDLIMTVFILPLGFLGTELAILTYIWMVVAIGMIVGFVMQMAGGRRV